MAIAQTSFPPDVIRQGVQIRKQSTDFLQVISLIRPNALDNVLLSNYGCSTSGLPSADQGVGFVRIFGARDYSMRIWLDPDKMARLGVTAGDVSGGPGAERCAPAGQVGVPPTPRASRCSTSVFVQGRLTDAEAVRGHDGQRGARRADRALKDVAPRQLGGVDYSFNVDSDENPAAFIARFPFA